MGKKGRYAQEVIVGMLRSAKGWVSGSALARKAGVSKMTIARQIDRLRKSRHKIQGSRGLGYRFKK